MSKPINLGTITPGGNAHLTTFLRRFSKRKDADGVATAIRERGIECITRDRGVGVKPRYDVLVTAADFGRAFPAMITYLQQREASHEAAS